MNLRQLELFVGAIRGGTLSGAAASVGLSQPGASHALGALEHELGHVLLARSRNGVTPTAAGLVFAAHAEAILDRAGLARRQLAELDGEGERLVRIGGFSSLAGTFLPGVVAALRDLDPTARVTTGVADTASLAAAVRSGDLDLAVGYDDADQPADLADLRRIDLHTEPLRAALPPHHRLGGAAVVALADLRDDDWIVPRPGHQILRACARAGFEPRVIAWTADAPAIRALVVAGIAVTLTPAGMDADLAPARAVPLSEPVERRVFAILPPGRTAAGTLAQRAVATHLGPRGGVVGRRR